MKRLFITMPIMLALLAALAAGAEANEYKVGITGMT